MTTNRGVISWRRTGDRPIHVDEGLGEVPGRLRPAPRGLASPLQGQRGCWERMLRLPPFLGGSEQPLVDPTDFPQVIVTSSYAN